MTSRPRAVLHVAPHPDDEVLGAPAMLMTLRDHGWRVVNLACSLGRPGDAARRRAELVEACRRAGFELVIPAAAASIGREDDLKLAQETMTVEIRAAAEASAAELIVGPSPHDGHHGHEAVAAAIIDAVEGREPAAGEPIHVMFWGLWRELTAPNLLVPYGPARLAEIQEALAAHAGELARNRYDRLLEGRALANAVVGPERLFGYGTRGIAAPYAELLTHLCWSAADGWQTRRPRIFEASDPLGIRGAQPSDPLAISGEEPSGRSSSSRSGTRPCRR